jgi:hypothetical protein
MNYENIPDERIWFTKQRSNNFKRYDLKTQQRLLDLEQRYGKICFTPLAVPMIKAMNQEKFVEWYFENSRPSIKQNKDVATQYTGTSTFKSIDLLPDWYDTSKSIWSKTIIKDFQYQWPDLWEQFHEYLPFKEVKAFSIWSSTKDVPPHRDQSLFFDIPLEFRVMLHDTNPTSNLFISESLPNSNIDDIQKTVPLPNDIETNSFAWSNLRSWHYSKYNNDHKKIIMIFHWINEIDWDRYETLIEKSYDLYREYSLTSDHTIKDFINYETE